MTRHQVQCARGAGACFALLVMIAAGMVLVSFGGCAAPEDDAAVAALAIEDLGPGSDCSGVAPRQLRILPAGDSITCGTDKNGGYRGPLFAALGARAESVGPRDSAADCGGPGFHGGYPGWRTTNYVGYLPGFLAALKPDVVLMMLGTNGTGGGAEYVSGLVRPALDADPALRLLVGAIPATPVQGDYPHAFNASLDAALRAVPEFGTRLWWVPETESAARPGEYGEDMFHPAAAGYARIADTWMAGLVRAGLVQR
jgi:lysophospholipase L1-like esterase